MTDWKTKCQYCGKRMKDIDEAMDHANNCEDDGAYDRAMDEIIERGEYRKGELDIHAALRRARNQ